MRHGQDAPPPLQRAEHLPASFPTPPRPSRQAETYASSSQRPAEFYWQEPPGLPSIPSELSAATSSIITIGSPHQTRYSLQRKEPSQDSPQQRNADRWHSFHTSEAAKSGGHIPPPPDAYTTQLAPHPRQPGQQLSRIPQALSSPREGVPLYQHPTSQPLGSYPAFYSVSPTSLPSQGPLPTHITSHRPQTAQHTPNLGQAHMLSHIPALQDSQQHAVLVPMQTGFYYPQGVQKGSHSLHQIQAYHLNAEPSAVADLRAHPSLGTGSVAVMSNMSTSTAAVDGYGVFGNHAPRAVRPAPMQSNATPFPDMNHEVFLPPYQVSQHLLPHTATRMCNPSYQETYLAAGAPAHLHERVETGISFPPNSSHRYAQEPAAIGVGAMANPVHFPAYYTGPGGLAHYLAGHAVPKKKRLQWTAELHSKFVAAVEELGIDTAVPKMLLQLMNVSGLTRENVASHLQKYRESERKKRLVVDRANATAIQRGSRSPKTPERSTERQANVEIPVWRDTMGLLHERTSIRSGECPGLALQDSKELQEHRRDTEPGATQPAESGITYVGNTWKEKYITEPRGSKMTDIRSTPIGFSTGEEKDGVLLRQQLEETVEGGPSNSDKGRPPEFSDRFSSEEVRGFARVRARVDETLQLQPPRIRRRRSEPNPCCTAERLRHPDRDEES